MEANDTQGVANLDSRGIVGTIYEEDHQTLLYSKYNAVGLMVIEDFFKVFPIICLRVIDPQGSGQFSSKGFIKGTTGRYILNI